MRLSLERTTAGFGFAYVALFASLLAFTTDGPDPTLPPGEEMARAVSEGTALRASAVLGFAAALAFAGFAMCLGLLLARAGSSLAAAMAAGGGVIYAAASVVSFAALVVAAEVATRDLGSGVFAAFGDLHTAALLLGLAPTGIVLLAASRAGLGRIVAWPGIVIGLGCLVASGAVMSENFDRGPLEPAVVLWFLGLPLWLIATSIVLIRRREAK